MNTSLSSLSLLQNCDNVIHFEKPSLDLSFYRRMSVVVWYNNDDDVMMMEIYLEVSDWVLSN